MNLKELKRMISQEYRRYLIEQEGMMDPTIDVSGDDVDMDTGGDSETTLRQIYDMLQSYFEGGSAGAGAPADTAGNDTFDDMEDAEFEDDEGEAEAPEAPAEEEEEEEEEEDDKDLKERFKKLANIIKG